MSHDRIEKKVFLRASPERVWRAISDVRDFNTWFHVSLEGAFAPGAVLRGNSTYEGHEHITMEFEVEAVEEGKRITLRWHPNAVDPNLDYSSEPTTKIVFELAPSDGGTMLTITESGFDKIPAARRESAFRGNSEGWEHQAKAVADYLSRSPDNAGH